MQKGKEYIGVGVGAFILNENNDLLLLQRNKEPEKGFWAIPGGSVEFNETIEEAVIREIKEGTDIDIEVLRLLCVCNHIVEKESIHWVSPEFLCKIVNGEIKNMEPIKHMDMKWFNIDNLPDNITITTKKGVEAIKTSSHILNVLI